MRCFTFLYFIKFLGDCNRTNGIVITGLFFQRKQQKFLFPCSVSRVTLHVSIKAANKKPVVLDANLTWKNPPGKCDA